ncbi:DUF1810 family protein [Sphingomonas arvum]
MGRSATGKSYRLSGEEEARAYLTHPLLGPSLRECGKGPVVTARGPCRR